MAYCGKCGTQMDDNAKFCPSCGAANEPVAPAGAASAGGAATMNTEELAGKGMSILAYLPLLVLIPLFAGGGNRFTRYHANQGLVLFLLELAVSIVVRVLRWILPYGFLWRTVNWVYSLCGLGFFVLAVIGILNVVNGRTKDLPFIGGVRILK